MPPRLPSLATSQANVQLTGSTAARTAIQEPWHLARHSRRHASDDKEISKRKLFHRFLQGDHARSLRKPTGRPNYLRLLDTMKPVNKPFFANPHFDSQSVLGEPAREKIWEEVIVNGEPVKVVSAKYGVDMRRVAAVVRLKEVEKRMEAEGRNLAWPYAQTILSMVPTQELTQQEPFEPVGEIHVHGLTMRQLFVPTSESRHFTREDAAKAFGDKMLPPDKRVQHPELIQVERDLMQGMAPHEAAERFAKKALAVETSTALKERKKRQKEADRLTSIPAPRFEYRFTDYNSEAVGKTGRARNVVGWRYGVPLNDRRRGTVKIPTKVE